jgi:protein O-GlcNAc transferase
MMIGTFNRLRRANSALLAGRHDEAASVARAVLDGDPSNGFAELILARALMEQEQCPGAIAHFQRYLAQVPTSADGHHWLAICLRRVGNSARALQETEAALAIDPRYADAQLLRGGILAEGGNVDGAIAAIRAAIAIESNRAVFHVGLGRILADAGRPGEAEPEFRQALTLAPYDEVPRFQLAEVLMELGHREEARAAYARILSSGTAPPDINAIARERLAVLSRSGK